MSRHALQDAALQDPAMGRRHDPATIPGWGADLDPGKRPAQPKERRPPRLEHPPRGQPEQQRSEVLVLHSTERPGVTPVFGTSVPPSGLSGVIRRRAFRRSENDVRHWLMLMVADRVNVVEGMVQDLGKSGRGRPLAAAAVVVLAGWWLLRR